MTDSDHCPALASTHTHSLHILYSYRKRLRYFVSVKRIDITSVCLQTRWMYTPYFFTLFNNSRRARTWDIGLWTVCTPRARTRNWSRGIFLTCKLRSCEHTKDTRRSGGFPEIIQLTHFRRRCGCTPLQWRLFDM